MWRVNEKVKKHQTQGLGTEESDFLSSNFNSDIFGQKEPHVKCFFSWKRKKNQHFKIVCIWTHTYISVGTRRRRANVHIGAFLWGSLLVDAGVFLDSPCYLLRQGLSGNLELTNWLSSWSAYPVHSCLFVPSAGVTVSCHICSTLSVWTQIIVSQAQSAWFLSDFISFSVH